MLDVHIDRGRTLTCAIVRCLQASAVYEFHIVLVVAQT